MQPGTTPLPPIQVKLGGAANSAGDTSSSPQSRASFSSEAGIRSAQAPRDVRDGTRASAAFASYYAETVKSVRRPRSELTSALSLTDAGMVVDLTPTPASLRQPSLSTPHSNSLSRSKLAKPTVMPPSPPDMRVPNSSFFAKKTSAALVQATAAASAAEVAPLRMHSITTRISPQPPMHRAVAVPAAAAAMVMSSSKSRLSRRRDSAWARTSVLAKARHRRLLPLIGTQSMGHEEGGDNIAIPTVCSTQDSVLVQSISLSSELQGSLNGCASALKNPLCKGSYHSCSQEQAAPSSPLSSNATIAVASALGLGATAGGLARSVSQLSSGSRRGEAAAPPKGDEIALASLTSLQQRLWGRTGGVHLAAPITAENNIDEFGPRPMNRQQTRSRAISLVDPRTSRASAAACAESLRVRQAVTAAGRITLAATVEKWKLLLDVEQAHGERGKSMARLLLDRLLGSTTTAGPFSGHCTGGGAFDSVHCCMPDAHNDEGGSGVSGGHLRHLCERAVVGAYLLSSLLDGLPRHQQSLSPYIHMLLDFTFVSDTSTNRAMLGGSVQDKGLLHALEMMREDDGGGGETAAEASQLPPGTIGRVSTSRLDGEVQHGSRSCGLTGDGRRSGECLYELLYPGFTRMTYVAAHYDAAQTTMALAHCVRSRELHQLTVPRLLAYTHRHWMRWLIRAVLRAWQRLCRERRVQEQRQRARWSERWTGERVRITLRRWRGYAALTLQIAEAESLAKVVLAEKRAGIERLEKESASMQTCSALLQQTLRSQEEEREAIEGVIVQREQVYKRLLQHVREVDRVGTLMLRSLLLPDAPPVPDEAVVFDGLSAAVSSACSAGGQRYSVVSPNASMADPRDFSATSPFSTDSDEPIVSNPPHALVALPTLLRWAKACVAKVSAEYVSFFPDDDKDDVAEAAAEGSATDDSTSHNPEEEEVVAGEKVSSGGNSVASASPLPQAKQDGNALAASPTMKALASGASSSGGSTNVSRELTRGPFIGLEMVLTPTAAAAPASTTRSISASDTVLVPLHLILLLMRGCSGAQDGSSVVGRDGHEVIVKAAVPLVTAARAADVSLANGDGVTSATCPSWDLVRAVELADKVVLEECHALLRKDATMPTGIDGEGSSAATSRAVHGQRQRPASSDPDGGRSTAASVLATGVSIMYRLTSATRENLQQVCRVVVDTYEQLTGTACVVTAERLFERSRGTLLVLIAALMRYYTSWATHCSQQLAPISIKRKCIGLSTSTAAAHEGTKHIMYEEWSHPPHSHRSWLAHVQRQAQWIALSFSALHDAVLTATHPPDVLSIIEQERVAGLLQSISLTELAYLLCRSPEHTMQSYVDMIGVVERYAPSLYLLFHRYALPLAQLRAGTEGAKANPVQSGDAYITGNTVWRLLCLTGLAGKAPRSPGVSSKRGVSPVSVSVAVSSPPLSATLSRPAVFSLIEHVTHGYVASIGIQQRRASMRDGGNLTDSPTMTKMPSASPDKTFSPRRMRPTHVVSVSCKGRPIPCYARAMRDDRHVDLRADAGAVCVDYVQFVKLTIRLAHAWQCQQQQQQPLLAEEALHHVEADEEGGRRATRSLTDVSAGSLLAGASRSSCSSSVTTSAEKSAACDHVQYEAVDYASPLCLSYFNTFLGGLLLPRLLGANRWIGAAQRAFLTTPVLALLAQNHDALLTVFKTYQRPSECRGVRRALPPPFSPMPESRRSTKIDMRSPRATASVTAGEAHRASPAERASVAYTAANGNSRHRSTATGEALIDPDHNRRRLPSTLSQTESVPGARDVGIVSVLRWKDVEAMAKDLEWYREARLSETVLRHCFNHVVADGAREGEVLFFAEFLQLLCAIAAYTTPDPTVPLETKLDSFLYTRVLGLLE
ncbi:hypothetical protein CUR178_05721 [Leishmania enriettii]|uniref:Uncharacterized protein n=1 Tax=Leishmania enriettii TaxID=5663 RepID=A0A836GYN7_LEIEN|nr:hypothetical protein CUR178_05721 [Leishmania enriettii]